MTVSLSLLGGAGWQFLDNSGNVLAGGRLFTYAAGTSTPLASYTSSTGLTANANPIILDSAGRVPLQIWLTDGVAYKFVLQNSAAEQIGAWDNVYATGVNTIGFGTTGLTPAAATSGVVTVAGTLNVANGGTGLSSLTAGRIPFGNGTAALDNSFNLTYTTGTNTFSAPIVSAATSMANAGNMLFSGTAARIQGDFSSTTLANRTAFQDKTTNNETSVYALPNGTSTASGFFGWNNSNIANAAYGGFALSATSFDLVTNFTGSAAALPMRFLTNNAEVGRFDTDGNFMVGRTSYSFLTNTKGTTLYNTGQVITETDASLTPFLINTFNGGVANNNAIVFYRQGAVAGFIFTSNGNTTTYGTSSDYRLKSNAQPLTGSGAFIDALQPKTWTWISSGTQGVGFIAHEAATVAPLSVNGQKDEVDENGNPKYQAIGYGSSEFIANIIAELKSLRARVAALEGN
jgi:hypothetical protein